MKPTLLEIKLREKNVFDDIDLRDLEVGTNDIRLSVDYQISTQLL
jgi:hypothetical protein